MSSNRSSSLSRCLALLLTCTAWAAHGADCNLNGILDSVEIAGTPSLDVNLDGVLDCCPTDAVAQPCSTNPISSLIPGVSNRLGYAIDRLTNGKLIMSDGPSSERFVSIHDPARNEYTLIANPAPTNVLSQSFGRSIAALPDGGFLIADTSYGSSGVVYRFSTPEAAPTVIASPGGSFPDFGKTMLPAGGGRYLISSPRDNSVSGQGTGAVYLFNSNNTLQVRIGNPGANQGVEGFGAALAMLGTNRVVIGVPDHTYGTTLRTGIIYIYDIAQGSFVATMQDPLSLEITKFGYALAAVGTNYFVAGGGYGGVTINDNARMYDRNGSFVRFFSNPTEPLFAGSIAVVGGDKIAIGDPFWGIAGGQVHIYSLCGKLESILYPPTRQAGDNFGLRVVALGASGLAVVEDGEAVDGQASAGVVHVYDLAGGSDCDGNGVQDRCQIAANPSLDANTNGILDVCDWKSTYTSMTCAGSFNGWSASLANMRLVYDSVWQADLVLSNQSSVAFKFVANADWAINWGETNQADKDIPLLNQIAERGNHGNITINGTLNGPYRVTFNEATGAYTFSQAGSNLPPVSVAGPNKSVPLSGGAVQLDGSASTDPDGVIVSYLWQQISGPAASISGATSAKAAITLLARTNEATCLFTLKVMDNVGATATSTVSVTQTNLRSYAQMNIRGTANNWVATPMTLVSNYVWEGTLVFGSSATERFKFDVAGDWVTNFGDNNADNVAEQSGADIAIRKGSGSYTIRFNDLTKQYWIIKQPGGPLSGMSVAGTFNGWSTAAHQMWQIDTYKWQCTLDLTNAVGVEFKFVANQSWSTNWGEADQTDFDVPIIREVAERNTPENIVIDGSLTGHFRVSFNSLDFTYGFEGSLVDCNGNGSADSEDIRLGLSTDCNANGIPDECETATDADGDGVRDICDPLVGIVCPSNLVVSAGGSNCCGNATLTVQMLGNGNTAALQIRNSYNAQQTATISSCFDMGQTPVVFTVTDGRKTNTCTTTVTVADQTPPVFTTFPGLAP